MNADLARVKLTSLYVTNILRPSCFYWATNCA